MDFVVVSDYVIKHMKVTSRNLLNGLVEYNDYVMTRIYSGVRTGVPQGPAYARIIAEVFLSLVLDEITREYQDKIYLYRYVDDIIMISKPGFDLVSFYDFILKKLENKGLPVNMEKSRCYGLIGSLSETERRKILHKDDGCAMGWEVMDSIILGKGFSHITESRGKETGIDWNCRRD